MSREATLVDLLRARARDSGDRVIYCWLDDRESAQQVTYAALDAQARAIAARLRTCCGDGDRVLLCYEPGLPYVSAFLGCLYAGVVAVPAYAPVSARSGRRVERIIADATPVAALSTSAGLTPAREWLGAAGDRAMQWIATDVAEQTHTAANATALPAPSLPTLSLDALAYLQYTSGSTTQPKGVMITHRNLVENLAQIAGVGRFDATSVLASWLPPFHDMGLVFGLLQPIFSDVPAVLFAPAAFVQRPLRWLTAVSRHHVTHSGGPDFAYVFCVDRIRPDECAQLDLRSWRVAFNGSEPVHAGHMARFADRFAPHGFDASAFMPVYGLAEATLMVTGGRLGQGAVVSSVDAEALTRNEVRFLGADDAGGRPAVSSGEATSGTHMVIVDPVTGIACPDDRVGEIWVRGPSVAPGYWGKPEETRATFGAAITGDPGTRFLRTGDLGFVRHGQLYVAARLKDCIIIRGQNLYPQDIEWTVAGCHPALAGSAAVACAIAGHYSEELAVISELPRHPSSGTEEIIEAIQRAVFVEHGHQPGLVALIKKGALPRTSSGKLQRARCRDLLLGGELPILARWTNDHTREPRAVADAAIDAGDARDARVLAYLTTQVARALRVAASAVDPDATLAGLGLDSMSVVELAHQIARDLRIDVSAVDLLRHSSLRAIAHEIAARTPAAAAAASGDARRITPGRGELSEGQLSLRLLDECASDAGGLNLARAVRVTPRLDEQRVRSALARVISRHDALRTAITDGPDGRPARQVFEQIETPLICHEAATWSPRRLRHHLDTEANRALPLSRAPLCRIHLYQGTHDSVLLLVISHLVADFWSIGLIVSELFATYAGGTDSALPPPVPFESFVEWQTGWLHTPDAARQMDYWREQFRDELPVLDLPSSRSPARRRGHRRSGAVSFALGHRTLRQLWELARSLDATVFEVMLAAFQVMLSRATGQSSLLIGCPTHGRDLMRFRQTVGYCVNPVVVRADLPPDTSFIDACRRARDAARDAMAHGTLPFLHVSALARRRTPADGSPIFQATFAFQRAQAGVPETIAGLATNDRSANLHLAGLTLRNVPVQRRTTFTDIGFVAAELVGRISCSLEYDTSRFARAEASAWAKALRFVIEQGAANPGIRIGALPLIGPADAETHLRTWNATTRPYEMTALPQIIEATAAAMPDAIAIVAETAHISYAALQTRANQLAHLLRAHGVGVETPVGILAERSIEMVVAILAVLKSGGAYVPLDPEYPPARLTLMLDDIGAPVLLTQAHLRGLVPDRYAGRVIVVGARSAQDGPESDLAPIEAFDGLAYIIYTSGSTGAPKGAMNTHRGLSNRIVWMQEALHLTPGDRVLQKTPFSFDVSVWEFLWPLATGATLVMARPGGHRDAAYLADVIARSQITTLHFVPSMLQAYLAQHLDPSAWRTVTRVVCSGEVLPPSLCAAVAEQSGAAMFNLYGPTEAAVDVSWWRCARQENGPVPIGRPIANIALYVLDAHGNVVPAGVAGELHIAGVGVGRGYWKRPDLTAERFVPNPFGPAGSRLYRTGDDARWRADGTLEFLGRRDGQVKLRGIRIELSEIESAVHALPGVRAAAARVWQTANDQRLVAYAVADAPLPDADVRARLSSTLPASMVPGSVIWLNALPRTSSGKLDRHALPAPPAPVSFVAPETAIEAIVCRVWGEVLGVRQVGVDADFFQLGGHSLLGMQAVARICEALRIEMSLRTLFEAPTAKAFSARCADAVARSGGETSAEAIESPATPRLTAAQQRLWLVHQLDPESPLHNMPFAARLQGPLQPARLVRALRTVVERHAVLRTCFPIIAGEPRPVIADRAIVDVPIVDLAGLPEAARAHATRALVTAEALRPFALESQWPFRASLLRAGSQDHVLLVTMHHIAGDAWSTQVLARELDASYNASPLPPLPVSYAAFVASEHQRSASDAVARDLDYWRQQLAGAPELDLPTDLPRLARGRRRGARVTCEVPPPLATRLAQLGREAGATPFMVVLAAFQAMLSRCCGQEDVVIGTDVANRGIPGAEALIGFFVNQLVLRTDLQGNPTFGDLLARVRGVVLAAFEHQQVPFDRVVQELRPERDLRRMPLVSVCLTFHGLTWQMPRFEGLTTMVLPTESTGAKFDWAVAFEQDASGGLRGVWEYDADLFTDSTMRRVVSGFMEVLRAAVDAPSARLADLPLLTRDEREERLRAGIGSTATLPAGSVVEQIHARADQQPDAIAVVADGQHLTYAALVARAGALAGELRAAGVGAEARVGVCLERGLDMVIAPLAVWDAGAAYVPVDLSYPAARQAYMLADAHVSAVMSHATWAPTLAAPGRPVIAVDGCGDGPSAPPATWSARQLAYVMYTSGSSGPPKGVLVEHGGMRNHLWAKVSDLQLTSQDAVAHTASVSFDVSIWQVFAVLLAGGRLVVLPADVAQTSVALLHAINITQVTTLETTPVQLAAFCDASIRDNRLEVPTLRWMICNAEALPMTTAAAWMTRHPHATLINAYGPTECSDDISHDRVTREDDHRMQAPLGRPLPNLRIYVLDPQLEPVPIGVAGELYIGGVGVSRGYLHRSALTAERFMPDRFGDEPGARWYRTGDRARWLADGRVEFLGRFDHQVKLRGYRVELGEIAGAIGDHPSVRDVTVVVIGETAVDKKLVAYVVPQDDRGVDRYELRAYVRRRLPEYMVPAAWVTLPRLPLTPNGKIDRRALPAPESLTVAAGEPPRTAEEEIVAGIWAEVLRVDRIAREADFFELGGHSLLATQVLSRVRELLGVNLPLRVLFETPTVAGLAEAAAASRTLPAPGAQDREATVPVAPPLTRMTRGATAPLSFAQQRLWFLDQLVPQSPLYNVALGVALRGPLDVRALALSLDALVARHEVLRTSLPAAAGQPVQVIAAAAHVPLPILDLTSLGARAGAVARTLAAMEAARPFDLSRGPLLRARLLRLAAAEHVLLLTLHHVISDGWSVGVLVRELTALYAATRAAQPSPLAPLPVQYADFAIWQRAWLAGPVWAQQMAYWRRQLAGVTDLAVPTDFARSALPGHRGAAVTLTLAPAVTAAVRAVSRREGVTVFMTLLAAFQVVLSRASGQTDIAVGTDVANRTRLETEGLIGFFVNQLVLRTDLAGDPTFRELLRRVRTITLDAYANQDVPFDRLVATLAPTRELGRSPLFQYKLVLQNARTPRRLDDLDVAVLPQPTTMAKFDMLLTFTEQEETLSAELQYSTELFRRETALRMLEDLFHVLAIAAADPACRLLGAPSLTMRDEAPVEPIPVSRVTARRPLTAVR